LTWQERITEKGFDCTYQQVLDLGAGKAKLQAIIDVMKLKYDDAIAHQNAENIHDLFLNQLENSYRNNDIIGQPNAEELFQLLKGKGIKVALNTGYSRNIADILLEKLAWVEKDLIDFSVTFDEVENGRPAPDMILHIMKHFEVENAAQVIKIGDAIIDIEEGKNAGCTKTFGITTGAHTRAQLQTATPTAV